LPRRWGREIARFHAAAPTRIGADRLAYVLASNAGLLRAQEAVLGEVGHLLVATERAYQAHAALLAARGEGGFVRRCHGDLHLGNIFLDQGRQSCSTASSSTTC
jgi:aminoglycoside phosphotransferase family enzyme